MALAVAAAARHLDEDLDPLLAALTARGVAAGCLVWDDPDTPWDRCDLVMVRSVWDYARRRDEFLRWAARTAGLTRLVNPPDVLAWTTDKRYLRALADAGLPVVPTRFVAPGEDPPGDDPGPVVVKPAVSAGSLDTSRHTALDDGARAAVAAITGAGRVAMVQPYVAGVDRHGEAGMVFVDGRFSHAVTKGAMLAGDRATVGGLFLEEDIGPRAPSPAERRVAEAAMDALPWPRSALAYGRVDLLPGPDGPLVLEVELAEPSLFLDAEPGAAGRVADALTRRLGSPTAR